MGTDNISEWVRGLVEIHGLTGAARILRMKRETVAALGVGGKSHGATVEVAELRRRELEAAK
jgi:hypothetical protein